MDKVKIGLIIEQAESTQPIGKGNSRICYRVNDLVVLIENGSQSIQDQNEKTKQTANKYVQEGVTTPTIHYVGLHDDKCVMIQDFVEGKPLYFRSADALCMYKGLPKLREWRKTAKRNSQQVFAKYEKLGYST